MTTVLVVDDDKVLRKQLHTLFDHGSGFDACMEAGNGVEALDKTALSCGITAVFSKLDDLESVVANARAVCGIE